MAAEKTVQVQAPTMAETGGGQVGIINYISVQVDFSFPLFSSVYSGRPKKGRFGKGVISGVRGDGPAESILNRRAV